MTRRSQMAQTTEISRPNAHVRPCGLFGCATGNALERAGGLELAGLRWRSRRHEIFDFTPEVKIRAIEAIAPFTTGSLFRPRSTNGAIVIPEGLVDQVEAEKSSTEQPAASTSKSPTIRLSTALHA